MIVGTQVPDWGGAVHFGPSNVLTMGQDVAQNLPGAWIRWEATATSGTELTANYLSEGLTAIIAFPGGDTGFAYNTGGVQTVNASTYASAVLAWYQAHCTPTTCPAIEVLNEPWNTSFWGGSANTQPNAAQHGAVVKAVYTAFDGVYGAARPKIISEFFGAPLGVALGTVPNWWTWLIAAHPDIAGYYDAIVCHPYSNPSLLGDRNLVLTAAATSGKKVWVTEVGWNTHDFTETQQATAVPDFVDWGRASGVCDAVFNFTYLDYSTEWFGLVRYNEGGSTVDYTRKPVWAPFAAVITAAPAVASSDATAVSTSTAVIAGTVNPNSLATSYWLEYGTTPSYGRASTPASAGAVGTDVPVSLMLSSLDPGTVVHYRLAASNADGTSYSTDRSFTTGTPAPVITSVSIRDISEPEHLAWPPALAADGTFRTVVQDTLDDIRQCVRVLLNTSRGIRPLAPDIGIDDPAFTGLDPDELEALLVDQEPRAAVTITGGHVDETGEQTIEILVEPAADSSQELSP